MGWDLTAGTESIRQLADMIGVTRRTIHHWKNQGVRAESADRAAVRVGYHPANIWPEQWASSTHHPVPS